jgi:hypothetical protein
MQYSNGKNQHYHESPNNEVFSKKIFHFFLFLKFDDAKVLGLLLQEKNRSKTDLNKYVAKLQEKCQLFIESKYPNLSFTFDKLGSPRMDSAKKKEFLAPIREFCKIQTDFTRTNKNYNIISNYLVHLSIKDKKEDTIHQAVVNQALLFLHQIAEKRFFDPNNQDNDIDFSGMITRLEEINQIKVELYDKKEIPLALRIPDLNEN